MNSWQNMCITAIHTYDNYIILTLPQYNWNIAESGVKHHNPNPCYPYSGFSKWAGTWYFYPPEIVYSTGRNYWTPQISGGQNHKYDGR